MTPIDAMMVFSGFCFGCLCGAIFIDLFGDDK